MKKNTLLYLDSNLVARAKRAGVNISKLAEEGLEQVLGEQPPLDAREYLRRMIVESRKERPSLLGEAHLLPFRVRRLRLERVGPHRDTKFEFKKDGLNVICGKRGSGKSIAVRSILYAFGIRNHYFNLEENHHGRVTVELFPNQSLVEADLDKERSLMGGYRSPSIVIDDALGNMPEQIRHDFCKEVARLDVQTIMTSSIPLDKSTLPRGSVVYTLGGREDAGATSPDN